MFLAGTCLWGIQGVILNFPHEIKTNSPQRVSIVISFAWGIGYLIYTISNIILASTFDLINSNVGLVTAAWVQFGLFTLFTFVGPIVVLILPKTQPQKFTFAWKKKK